MTTINAGLACSLGLQEQRDPDPRSASGYWPVAWLRRDRDRRDGDGRTQ
jgi:hypothetical protein